MLDCLLTTLIRELQCDGIEGRRAEARRVAARFVRSVARIFVVLNAEMTPQSGKKRLLVSLHLFDFLVRNSSNLCYTFCWTVFTGFWFRTTSSLSCVCWRLRRCTDSHQCISPICANQSRQSEADRGCALLPSVIWSLVQHPSTSALGHSP